MVEALSLVIFGPLVLAAVCFVVSVFHATLMFSDIRSERRFAAYLSGPLAFFSSSFYGPQGRQHFARFQVWFKRFALWLFVWGFLALAAALVAHLS